ncbi:MAG TPA: 2-dehydropantoate 2-reductase [Polyangia bacterium]|jgi:2-dehydropantoate 2-reductase|nr:2-dehydropantoate 2-reductase [Polyangia bacterium]
MRIAVIGCGGIGGVVAATLTRAGADVTPVVGNPAVAAALNARGYRVRELDGNEWSVKPSRAPILEAAESDAPFDLAIVATQSTTLEKALTGARAKLTDDALVVTCQNGLPEDRARAVVGDRVVGCVVGWGASMVEAGVYKRTSKGGLTLEGVPGAAGLAPILLAASPVVVAEDFAGVRWSKLAINCVTTTLGAIGGVPLGRLLSHRPVRRLALEVFAEVAAVAAASGVRVQPVGGTLDIDKIAINDAERNLSFGSPALAYKHSVLLAVGFKYRRMRSSMLYALERGRPPEIDFLNGEIVRRGAALGVPTPVSSALVATVREIEARRLRSDVAVLRALHDRVVVAKSYAAAA